MYAIRSYYVYLIDKAKAPIRKSGQAVIVEGSMRKHWAQVTGRTSKPGEPVKMARFFFVARDALTFIGASAVDEDRARELIPIIRDEMRRDPGTFARVFQPSLFGRSIGRITSYNVCYTKLLRQA